jgi:cytochrome P450
MATLAETIEATGDFGGAVPERRSVRAGEVICTEGEQADRWWIVVDGLADVTSHGLYVATIGPGESIGELALLDREPRNATVTAATDMVLQELAGDGFIPGLLARPDIALALLREVAVRLRRSTDQHSRRRTVVSHASQPVMEDVTELDPRAEGYFHDPYPHTRALRERAPAHFSEAIGAWVVTRYEDVHRLTRDRSLLGSAATKNAIATLLPDSPEGALLRELDKTMISRDGEDHIRLRRLVSKVFTPRAVQQWRERAESVSERLLAEAESKEKIDVLTEYALPLPVQIISEMLGMPLSDVPQLREWSRILVRSVDPLVSAEEQEAADAAGIAMAGYIQQVIDDKRQHLSDDILSGLIQAEEEGDRLDGMEILSQVMMLYIAGHETTTNLVCNGLAALFRFPEQLDLLRSDPALEANAVEELLRFDSPAQFTRRVNTEPLSLGDAVIPRGSLIFLALGSANHDERKWGPTADVLDITRPGANEHVSFGGGPHYCLGASLARLEGRVAVPAFLRRFPHVESEFAEPTWVERMSIRGVESLPVVLRNP